MGEFLAYLQENSTSTHETPTLVELLSLQQAEVVARIVMTHFNYQSGEWLGESENALAQLVLANFPATFPTPISQTEAY